MWYYIQPTGELLQNALHVATGYAGRDAGKNNPAMQHVPDIGPLPCGVYTIEPPIDTATHGPFVMWLTPDLANQMFGRADFGIHGDSIEHPGLASEGCIVQARTVREQIWSSGDHQLTVLATLPMMAGVKEE